ncbi:MAG: hypothetical protein KBB11_04685 [Bacteroidales bacterium]|nr:hypothetical protein [Bacteroidales bacterium]HOY39467.1 hypothetical protein [Bacteroidales bacterium]HQP04121.1 hypothetical protein [Bacteroidales bacterium]
MKRSFRFLPKNGTKLCETYIGSYTLRIKLRGFFIVFFTVLSSVHCFGQNDSVFKSLQPLFESQEEIQCDSVSSYTVTGKIECKLIFSQRKFDSQGNQSVDIGRIKVAVNDQSILLSEEKITGKKVLQLGYDTCYVREFTQKDNMREYSYLMLFRNKSVANDWEIEVSPQGSHCIDTDYHWVKISKDKDNFICFSCLYNIKIIELDLNADNQTEIYLISYIFCEGKAEIYRINNKN